MEFGICLLSIVPVRSEPSNKFEMVSQLLFGELFSIIDNYKDWYRIRFEYDKYEGWVEKVQVQKISESEFQKIISSDRNIIRRPIQQIKSIKTNISFSILIGSLIPAINKNTFVINNEKYSVDGIIPKPERQNKNLICKYAELFLNAPYLWGGRTPFGIDCSGLTQICYKLAGHEVMRDASQQATQGETLNLLSEATAGDLLFFDNNEGEIIHSGILLPGAKIIHASGKVRIDDIDHHGIYNFETKKYSHKLRLIKKII